MEYEYSYLNTGKRVYDLRTGKIGVILRENKTLNTIHVLQNIAPYVIGTYDSFNYLKFVNEEEK